MELSHENTNYTEEKDPLLARFNKRNPPPNTLVKFNATAGVRLSKDLYDINIFKWPFTTYGYRALFAIAQSINKDTWYNDVFIKQTAMFQYLGLQNSNQRYKILAQALTEVRSASFYMKDEKTKKWKGFGFIGNWDFTEGNDYIHIPIDPDAKPMLYELKQYVQIQPQYYLALKDEYQNWLYPMLKLRVQGEVNHFCRWEVTIDYISTALKLEDKKMNQGKNTRLGAYDKRNKDRIGNILKHVIGIRISEEAQLENRRAAAERRKPKEVAWNYTTSRDGKLNGTLYTISTETDISVKACALKDGRAYSRVVFFISLKEETLSANQRMKEHLQIQQAADEDMGKRKPNNGGEESLLKVIKDNIPANAIIYSGRELMEKAREFGWYPKTPAQAATMFHKKKIGDDQYA